ncbi:murein L,D-transpeptidase catalytic domain family protein [Pedobacter sp. MC2016-24]|uniref:murein L,D-transpeptidase catalytic domain family protein n=1 Tax=Pedobacter sp. MC2016-24 TaxID=2780090 RepID=UPI0018825F4D|nr:murein L,D-transpeptidase catalytic domain family protein [Pedobacter sp. MC2016-24]MBE9599568.1 murein L,D-transpeptidase catalytic domain family protein [Pedobacter sp. MC2016-24]
MKKYVFDVAVCLSVLFALTLISFISADPNLAAAKNGRVPKDSLSVHDLQYDAYVKRIYDTAHLAQSGLTMQVFEKAVTGFYNLRNSGKIDSNKAVLTIADLDMSSKQKRLWIVDLNKSTLLLNTWVAHGQRSGEDKAVKFSNTNDSFQSSLGFYVTGEVYHGQHGRSLRLDGMDDGFNSNARKRDIVVHGATYVNQGTINALGRLGRSLGCPAVAPELADEVINTIEGKTVLFINSTSQNYSSKYLDEHMAATLASANHSAPMVDFRD